VSLISGFLGSGKTTVVNYLLTVPAMSGTLVLVNEFGQIAIDSDLIRRADDTVVEMKNGCVCCSLNDDLGTTLARFVRQRRAGDLPPFRKVLIETTGLANAGPIVRVILEDPLVREDYRLDRVLTTVDSINGSISLNLHAECVEQVAVADRLVVTKTDLLANDGDQTRLRDLIARLENLNPMAPILTASRGCVNSQVLLGEIADAESRAEREWASRQSAIQVPIDGRTGIELSSDGRRAIPNHVHRHDHHIRTFCIVRDKPVSLAALNSFWSELAREAGPNLLRVKGLVNIADCPDQPAVVQGVQQIFDDIEWLDEWPSEDRRTRLVLIGWMIDEERIRKMLQ